MPRRGYVVRMLVPGLNVFLCSHVARLVRGTFPVILSLLHDVANRKDAAPDGM